VRFDRIYVAHPITSYGTAHERWCLDRLAELLPGVCLLNPAEIFANGAEWDRAWPRLLPRLAGLVAFTDAKGNVGAGVLREVADAIAYEIPVAGFDHRKVDLCEVAGVDLTAELERSARECGTLRFGNPIIKRNSLVKWPTLFDHQAGCRLGR
jgi:hypothetical protein